MGPLSTGSLAGLLRFGMGVKEVEGQMGHGNHSPAVGIEPMLIHAISIWSLATEPVGHQGLKIVSAVKTDVSFLVLRPGQSFGVIARQCRRRENYLRRTSVGDRVTNRRAMEKSAHAL